MRRIALSGLLAATLASLPLATLAQEVTLDTAQGPVTLPATPRSVAVYDMAALDTLQAFDVVPTGTIDRILVPALQDAAPGATPVGTLFEPDLEALAALAPDLVIVGGRSMTQLAAVGQVAPAIDMSLGPDLLADARARITAYGTLFDMSDRAAEMTATLDSRLEDLRDAAEGQGSALIVMTNGPKMSAYGAGSRFGWIFDATGLTEAVPGLDDASHGQAISHEFIAEADPDWLLVIDRGAAIGADGAGATETLASALVEGTTAWQQDQVILLDPAATYISAGGYGSMIGTLDLLTEALSDGTDS
ncbi:siderophore ABC transporter substrate-binding protein [Paracoccus gahaiensis]|uniref:Siderophore ABC transporter substrate-binding protein n=1 Tax=Paracoccus gahaiensis TaxID=1706839 RepID=A0A4U0RY89_9RHOB|nr:siderophore ABC transporter substrate-binding protein [Paracoccus gahaiensis]TJZ93324.1 siderophore ABC transporter substrate-binding protein [Paracoccus gahaiensis]